MYVKRCRTVKGFQNNHEILFNQHFSVQRNEPVTFIIHFVYSGNTYLFMN